MRRLWNLVLLAAAAVALPCLLLVRVSVVLYVRGWPAWLAVSGSVLLVALVLSGLAWLVIRRLPHRPRWRTVMACIALPATVGFTGQGLLVLGDGQAKTSAERADWRRTHPLLRLSVATLTLVDRDLVVTDLARTITDYGAWGLEAHGRSPHLRQADGYSHAMDLRTLGHGRIRNWLLQGYFRLMGFDTLRHVGTADHLHVDLPGH